MEKDLWSSIESQVLKKLLDEARFDLENHNIEPFQKWANFVELYKKGTLKRFTERLADCDGAVKVTVDGQVVSILKFSFLTISDFMFELVKMRTIILDNAFKEIMVGDIEIK